MGRRRAARGPAGGGGVVPATRRIGARVTLAGLSALAYAGVVAYACTLEPAVAGLAAGFGLIGMALLAFVLFRGARELLPWAVLCAAAAYATGIFFRGAGVDGAVPLVATGLLVCAELATWSLDERHRIAVERAVVLGRASGVAALAAAGLVAAGLVVGLAAAPGGAGFGWTLLGAAAAVLAVGIAARLARR